MSAADLIQQRICLRELLMDVRPPANLVHMVPGFRDNLLSTGKFVDAA